MNRKRLRQRRAIAVLISTVIGLIVLYNNPSSWQRVHEPTNLVGQTDQVGLQKNTHDNIGIRDAMSVLSSLPIKGKAPKTGYARTQFGDGWTRIGTCDMRNIILNRDLVNRVVGVDCKVLSGTLQDPYTGEEIVFQRGPDTSDKVQIDHVVALSNAWQTGAQQLSYERRKELANDPLELLAVDGQANRQKSDGDAATWLPPYKSFRCQYVARQIAVKEKYSLWVTQAEYDAMHRILSGCPGEPLPVK